MSGLIRVLVVDDDARFASNMVKLLEAYGLLADTVNSGEEALKSLGRDAYDVVLLDVRLPGLTGTATLEHLAQAGVEARIIVVTGHASADDAAEFLRLGAFDYLLKPCKTEKLLEVIRGACGSKTGATVG
ncbi:response regulator [Desulfovibrio aminophilus]|nr:response regulator [Desulfovibrio aminophilus]MCM0755085.1 response regulator [Desulfovibrio aminophilus]